MTRIQSTHQIVQNSGVWQLPEWSVTLDGGIYSITLGTGYYALCRDDEGISVPEVMRVPGATFVLPHNVVSMVQCHYNNGNPELVLLPSDAEDEPNEITEIPVLQCFPYTPAGLGTPLISVIDFDNPGKAGVAKILRRLYSTEKIKIEQRAFPVSDASPNRVIVGAGHSFFGVDHNTHLAISSATATTYLVYNNPLGNVVHEVSTSYNNLYWVNAGVKEEILPNTFTINWIYRSVRQDSDVILVLLDTRPGFGTAEAAEAATLPIDIPEPLREATAFCGRIVVAKNALTATSITQWWDFPRT